MRQTGFPSASICSSIPTGLLSKDCADLLLHIGNTFVYGHISGHDVVMCLIEHDLNLGAGICISRYRFTVFRAFLAGLICRTRPWMQLCSQYPRPSMPGTVEITCGKRLGAFPHKLNESPCRIFIRRTGRDGQDAIWAAVVSAQHLLHEDILQYPSWRSPYSPLPVLSIRVDMNHVPMFIIPILPCKMRLNSEG